MVKNIFQYSNSYFHKFLVTMVPGFEEIVKDEIIEKIPNCGSFEISRGKVLFHANCVLDQLLELKCADNIYYWIGNFKIGPHKIDLKSIPNLLKKIKIIDAVNYYTVYSPKSKLKVIVSASRVGKHTYSRFDVANVFQEELTKKYSFIEGSTEDHDLSFRVDIVNMQVMISLKLTSADFRYRSAAKQFSSGAIRPTIAHALIRLSNPQRFDTFLDPFCGTGTIVAERAYFEAARIIASDINPDVVAFASHNIFDGTEIYCVDACHTLLADESISTIVSNLPWGKQIIVNDLDDLYVQFLLEAKRILRKQGKIIVLTNQTNSLNMAANFHGFSCSELMKLSLHGLHPSVFLLTKN